MIVRRSLGLSVKALGFEKRVAVGRTTVSSPAVLKPLLALNEGKPYRQQIKPFNIHSRLSRAQAGASGWAWTRSASISLRRTSAMRGGGEAMPWIDQYSGKWYRITASGPHGSRTVARVKSYGDVLREYEYHPEAKCADANGAPCSKQTVGLLRRRRIAIDGLVHIGKESNRLEEVEEQSLLDPSDVYAEYPDSRRDEWATKILPRLKAMPLRELMERTGLPRSTIQAIRAGRRPRDVTEHLLTGFLLRSSNIGNRST